MHRQDEVAVREPLHQRRRAQPVGAVVGEVRLADRVQPRDRRHQVVVDPQPAHRVVRGGVDAHRHAVGVLAGDALVHLEEVAVAGADDLDAEPRDRVARSRGRRRCGAARRRGPRRSWSSRCARRRRAGRGCRTPGSGARGSSRARPRGCRPRCDVVADPAGAQMRPSLRSDSLISVSLDCVSSDCGMQVGWICVKHGFANAAPRFGARARSRWRWRPSRSSTGRRRWSSRRSRARRRARSATAPRRSAGRG